jgi:hypothetical protein
MPNRDHVTGWSLESPVIGNGHAGFYVEDTIMWSTRLAAQVFPAQHDSGW